jgi:mannose-6-phosphate isomerase-like protein (cupin superfamily)
LRFQQEAKVADVTLKHFDELDNHGGMFLYARKGLGVTAWGMNVERLPANWAEYPEHDHDKDGQEEVYVPLEGSATLECEGETWKLEPGTLARVGPGEKRKVVPGDQGVTMLVIGGTPGKPYTPES